jgi:flagellar motility protein MotE (MotC chaperone)
MKNIKFWIVLFLIFSPLFAVDRQKLLDCYDIFEEKRAELEAEAEKILEQREALESLKNTYMALIKKKETKLKAKEKEINATLEKIENEKKEIQKLIEENKKILQEIKQAKMDKVTKSFAKMRPKNAAQVLSNMKNKDALNILEKLPPKIVAKIFAKMDPNKAAKLTEMMQKVDTNESSNSP